MQSGWALLVDLMATLAGAFLLGAVMERFRQPALLGYILAGLILGPGLSGVVRSVDAVRALSEIGVALLLFSIGLEFSWKQLKRLGKVGLLGGTVQVAATALAGYGGAMAFGLSHRGAVAAGAVVALSSTVVVLKLLKERGDLDAPHGKASMGMLIFQDIAFVPLVIALTVVGGESSSMASMEEIGPAIAQFLVVALVFTLILVGFLPRVLRSRALSRNRELPILLAVTTCMGAAWGAHSVGLSPAIGAFIGGLVLSETAYADQIRADVGPLRILFATLFFASVGMLADARWIPANIGAVLLCTVIIVTGKTVLAFAAARVAKLTTVAALATGLCLAQVGELSFVLLQVSQSRKLLSSDEAQLLLSASVLTMLLCPFLIAAAPSLSRTLAARIIQPKKLAEEEETATKRSKTLSNHVVVVGFGEAGFTASRELVEAGVDVMVLDIDRKLVRRAREIGCHSLLGDGTQPEMMEHARAAQAAGVIVAVSDHRSARLAISAAKTVAPNVPVVVRVRYHPFREEIAAAGADRLVDEEELVGERLGEEMAVQLGLYWDHTGRDD